MDNVNYHKSVLSFKLWVWWFFGIFGGERSLQKSWLLQLL